MRHSVRPMCLSLWQWSSILVRVPSRPPSPLAFDSHRILGPRTLGFSLARLDRAAMATPIGVVNFSDDFHDRNIWCQTGSLDVVMQPPPSPPMIWCVDCCAQDTHIKLRSNAKTDETENKNIMNKESGFLILKRLHLKYFSHDGQQRTQNSRSAHTRTSTTNHTARPQHLMAARFFLSAGNRFH